MKLKWYLEIYHKMTTKHSGPVIDCVNEYEIIDCEKCGFRHALLLQDMSEIYTSHYYETEKPDYILFNENDAEWWEFNYTERILKIDTLMNSPANRWLDIGTGPGLFLDALRKLNRVGTGIEPSLLASKHAISKGHNVINGYFNLAKTEELGEFDAIHLSEVLEHVQNPLEFLENVGRVLRPGGYVCIVVPNDYNRIQEIFVQNTKQNKWWLQPPFHLNYFDKQALVKLISLAGLEVELVTSNFPIDIFLLMGDVYIGDEEVGKSVHERRKQFEKSFQVTDSLDVLRGLYDSLANIGLGRELVVYARKSG